MIDCKFFERHLLITGGKNIANLIFLQIYIEQYNHEFIQNDINSIKKEDL